MALRQPSRRHLLAQISGRDLDEWMVYADVEPFGEERADLRMAILAALLANINRDRKEKLEPYTPEDFLPHFGGDMVQEQTVEQQLDIIQLWHAALGGDPISSA